MMSFSSTKGIDNRTGDAHGSAYPLLKLQESGSVIRSVVSDSATSWTVARQAPPLTYPLLPVIGHFVSFCRYFKQYCTFLVQSSVSVGLKKVKVLVAQSGLTLYDLMDYSLPSFSVHRILQARIQD